MAQIMIICIIIIICMILFHQRLVYRQRSQVLCHPVTIVWIICHMTIQIIIIIITVCQIPRHCMNHWKNLNVSFLEDIYFKYWFIFCVCVETWFSHEVINTIFFKGCIFFFPFPFYGYLIFISVFHYYLLHFFSTYSHLAIQLCQMKREFFNIVSWVAIECMTSIAGRPNHIISVENLWIHRKLNSITLEKNPKRNWIIIIRSHFGNWTLSIF